MIFLSPDIFRSLVLSIFALFYLFYYTHLLPITGVWIIKQRIIKRMLFMRPNGHLPRLLLIPVYDEAVLPKLCSSAPEFCIGHQTLTVLNKILEIPNVFVNEKTIMREIFKSMETSESPWTPRIMGNEMK